MEKAGVLCFTYDILGHHLEYVHHLYEMAAGKEERFVFVVPRRFEEVRDRLTWTPCWNITFDFIAPGEESAFNAAGSLKKSYLIVRCLKKKVREFNPRMVFCLHLLPFAYFAPLLLRKESLAGIVYKVPLYEQGSTLKRLRGWYEFRNYAKFRVFRTVLVLNDPAGAADLNRRYRTEKFVMLPDPYLPIPADRTIDIRQQYQIPDNQLLFVHLGAIAPAKGSLDILKSIPSVAVEDRPEYCFFFAGKVQEDFREAFYSLKEKVGSFCRVIVVDQFCEYSFLGALCAACDAILTPYHRTSQSSGMLGYAAQFGKPVIAPSAGLLGRLVGEYRLGYQMKEVSADCLVEAYQAVADGRCERPTSAYCEVNSKEAFLETIQGCL